MVRVSEHVIVVHSMWFIVVPLFVGMIGISCLFVGVFGRDRVQLLISAVCFLLLVIFFIACDSFIKPARAAAAGAPAGLLHTASETHSA